MPGSHSNRIAVLRTDITTLRVDAIVNAANERMLGGGGVDGAIHRAAGPELVDACERVPEVRPGVRCPTGQARITPGFRLPARFVIHTVGPIYRGGEDGEPELLANCYRSSLGLAEQHGLGSVAFPAISCGVYGYPPADAARIAVHEVAAFLGDARAVQQVTLVAFDTTLEQVLAEALRELPARS
jgi:O-acetyl-ADP-ribose deacetylase (regulator of RNase III)